MNIKYTLKHYLNVKTHSATGSSLRQWCGFLIRNWREIQWQFIPRVLFVTIVVILFTPLRWYESIRFKKVIEAQTPKAPLFILGHYRSGTTFLHYLVSQDDNLAYASTVDVVNPLTFLGSSGFSKWLTQLLLPKKRPMDNLAMSPNLPFEEEFALANFSDHSLCKGYFLPSKIQQAFDHSVDFKDEETKKQWQQNFYYYVKKLSLNYPDKQLLLKTPANTARVQAILDIFPDAKFIHIHRNPYTVYLSNERLYESILPILGFQHANNADIQKFIISSYRQTYERYLLETQDLKPEQLFEIDYESFVNDPAEKLKDMYNQLQLTPANSMDEKVKLQLKDYSNYQTNSYNLEPSTKILIQSQWQFAFDAFGYEI